MPVYLRKNLTITPPSISELLEDDTSDFLQDPDQLRDVLPQPYRMIDRVLTSIFDDAWDIISCRDKERVAEASRIRPPQYQASLRVNGHGTATCLCETDDGMLIVAGLPNGLAIIEALSQNIIDTWIQDDLSVTQMQVTRLKEEQYLICTCDEEGIARVFCAASGKIYLVQTMNEAQSGSNITIRKCEAAKDGTFVGVYFENSTTNEGYLELHKSPLETWLKELDAAVSKAASKTQAPSPQPQQNEPEISASPSGGDAAEGEAEKSTGAQGGDARNIKFTQMNLVVRLRPQGPIQPIMLTSPPQLAKDQGDVLGTGINHLLSAQHLDGRQNWFAHHHQQYMKYLPTEELPSMKEPTFHFLTPGRTLPYGLENPILASSCTSVAVWWTGSYNLMFYSLTKSAKETEIKPDGVWPFAHNILASTVSPCTSLIALALANGSVIIWDKNLGMERRVIHLTHDTEIEKITFLDPSICPQDLDNYPPYGLLTNVYLLATCKDSQMFLVECELNKDTPPSQVTQAIENKDERYIDIKLVAGIPNMVLACRQDGIVYLINLLGGNVICEITFPENYQLATPWKPSTAIGGLGQMVYIKAETKKFKKVSDDDNEVDQESESKLFVFPLRQYNLLNRHRIKERPNVPYTIHSTAQNRIDALMSERLSQQSMRKDRMQARWGQMKSELELMIQIRKEAATRISNREPYVK